MQYSAPTCSGRFSAPRGTEPSQVLMGSPPACVVNQASILIPTTMHRARHALLVTSSRAKEQQAANRARGAHINTQSARSVFPVRRSRRAAKVLPHAWCALPTATASMARLLHRAAAACRAQTGFTAVGTQP
eukprot:496967-Prymnesium_polylepis.1